MRNAAFLKLALLAAAASFAGGCTVHRHYGSSPAPANYSYGRPAYPDRYYENNYGYEPTRSGGKAVDGGSTSKPAKPDKPKVEKPKPNRDKPSKKPPRRNVADDGPRRTNPGAADDGPRRTDPTVDEKKREAARREVKAAREPTAERRTEIRPERKPTVKKPTVKKPQGDTESNAARRTTVKPRPDATKPRRETTATVAPRRTTTSTR